MVPDAHSLILTPACVGQLKALSSEVLLHGGIHGQQFGDGMGREAPDEMFRHSICSSRGLAAFN
jgi:hypothetical protein